MNSARCLSVNLRACIVICASALAACAMTACGEKKTELGEGSSEVTGSAGPAGAQGANPTLERCEQPIATVALLENPRGYVMPSAVNLPPTPVPLVKLLMQQSGCFRVVDRAGGCRAPSGRASCGMPGCCARMARWKRARATRRSTR